MTPEKTERMDPEIKVLWLERLESGKEKQGDGALKKVFPTKNGKVRKVRHCCLGVLCEIAKERGIVSEVEIDLEYADVHDQECGILASFDDAQSYLPAAVADWAGIPRHFIGSGGVQERLADINDDSPSFKKVAKYIKENL